MTYMRLAVLFCVPALLSAAPGEESVRLARLEMLADIWGKLYISHPNVASGTAGNFDTALIIAIPAVEQAQNTEELVSALNEVLFQLLRDPMTMARRMRPVQIAAPRPFSARMISN